MPAPPRHPRLPTTYGAAAAASVVAPPEAPPIRTRTEPVVPGFTPEQVSVIRHIAELTANTIAERSSAGIYTDATERADRRVRDGTRTARLREKAAWAGLVSAVILFSTAQLRSCANEIELRATAEPPIPIVIPIPAEPTGPTAEQVKAQSTELAALREQISALVAAEQARAEAVKPKRRVKP